MLIENDFIDNIINLLSYYDNIHDFGILCTKNNKNLCNYLYNSYSANITENRIKIKEILNKYFNINLANKIEENIYKWFDNNLFLSFDKDKHIFIDTIKYIIDSKINTIKKINIENMQEIILNNFN